MNAKSGMLAAALLLSLAPALLAADAQGKSAAPKDSPKCERCKDACKCEKGKCQCAQASKDSKEKTVMLTGSNIPQKVTEAGGVTESAEPLTVISHDDLERTGETNLAAALRKSVPGIR